MNEKKLGKALLSVFIFALGAAALSAGVTYTPPSPRTGEAVTFTLVPSGSTGSVNWNFGDGSPVQTSSGLTITHVYTAVGTYTVSAAYFTMSHANVDQATVVVTDPRQITYAPPSPRAGQAVAFTALNFFSSCIHWDFGDGTAKDGAASESHAYAAAGSYTVRAFEECGSTYGAAVTVTVAEAETPPTPTPTPTPIQPTLAVTFVSLYFEGGLAEVSVGKDFSPLQAFADLQVAGTGILEWQWLVDDTVVKSDTMAVSLGDKQTIDSGKVPGLPTSVPGSHRVTLRFRQPTVDLAIPDITYFVELRGPKPVIQKVTPDTLAPGSEYKLDLEGTELTPDTEISFPASIAVVKKPVIRSSRQGQVTVFVAPNAAAGVKPVRARNEYGTSEGPGQVTIGSPGGERPGPKPPPTEPRPPRPPRCPDIAITSFKALLVGTQVGDPSVDFPHDMVRLEVTLGNVGTADVTSLFIIDLFVRRNGELIFAAGDPGWSSQIGTPGSRYVIDLVTDSFPHNLQTVYTVEARPLTNECSTDNNQASLTIDEYKLHHQFRPGKIPQKPEKKPASPSSINERLKTIPRIMGWIDCHPQASPPYADAMICLLRNDQPVSDAVVKVDGTTLTYGGGAAPYGVYYHATLSLDSPLGHEFSVSVSVGGNTYTGKGGKIDNIIQLVQPAAGVTIHPPTMPQLDFQWTYSSGVEPVSFHVEYHCPPPAKVLFSGPVTADHVTVPTSLITPPGGGVDATLAKEFAPIAFEGLAALNANVKVFHSSFQPQVRWPVSFKKNPPPKEAETIPPAHTVPGLLTNVPRVAGQINYYAGSYPAVDFYCRVWGEGVDVSDAVVTFDGVAAPRTPQGIFAATIYKSVPLGHRFTVTLTTNGKTYTGLSGPINEIYKVESPKDGATIVPRQWPHIDCTWLNYGMKPVELMVTFWDYGEPIVLLDQLVYEDHAHVSTDKIPDGHIGTISAGLRTWYPAIAWDGPISFKSSIEVIVKTYVFYVVAF